MSISASFYAKIKEKIVVFFDKFRPIRSPPVVQKAQIDPIWSRCPEHLEMHVRSSDTQFELGVE